MKILFVEFVLILRYVAVEAAFVEVNSADLEKNVLTLADNYKSLSLHNDLLYIGGKGVLYLQKADNISVRQRSPVKWEASEDQLSICKGLSQVYGAAACYNYIQTTLPYNDSYMILCGSNALRAQNGFLNVENGTVTEEGVPPIPLCSYDHADRGVAIVGIKTNASSTIAAVSREQPQDRPNIIQNLPDGTTLFTTEGVGKMLDSKANFVYSFKHEDVQSGSSTEKLYFVFGEAVQEPEVYYKRDFGSRIAQVCANDIGGMWSDQADRWTSFLKAPLLCQSDEKTPFIFVKVTHSALSNDGILYGTFTSMSTQYRRSAVCAFRISDIQNAFRAQKFWGIADTGHYEMKTAKIPKHPSPGDCIHPGLYNNVNTSKDLSSDFLTFMRIYPLVASPITPVHPLLLGKGQSGPMWSMNDVHFTQIAIQTVRDLHGVSYNVIFVGTNTGSILKLFAILKNSVPDNRQLAQYNLGGEKITGLLLSDKLNVLYVNTDSKIVQIATGNCDAYAKSCTFCDKCRMCILAGDPMCAWNNLSRECVDIRLTKNTSSLRQDVANSDVELCDDIDRDPASRAAPLGRSDTIGEVVDENSDITVRWCKDTGRGDPEQLTGGNPYGKYRIDGDQRLEIKRFTQSDIAKYIAEYSISGSLVAVRVISYSNELPLPTKEPNHDKISGNNTNITTVAVNPISPASSAVVPVLIVLLLLTILALFVFVICYVRKRDCRFNKFPPTNKYPAEEDVRLDEVRSAIERKGCKESSEELDLMLDTDNYPQNMPAGDGAASKLVAMVTPLQEKGDKSWSQSGAGGRGKSRNPVKRAKSFQSSNIKINLPDNKVYKCHSFKHDKDKNVLTMTVNVPQGYRFDESSDEDDDARLQQTSFISQPENSNGNQNNNATSERPLLDTGTVRLSGHSDLDTDSDSTIKAADRSISSSASTLRPDRSRPVSSDQQFFASSMEARRQEPTPLLSNDDDRLEVGHCDMKKNQSKTSRSSSGSQSSTDQYFLPSAGSLRT